MVGRKSSMLLTAFCMTVSNTHSRGRHSSSISFVDDAGKYLGESQGHAERGRRWMQTSERGVNGDMRQTHTQSDLQAAATNHRLKITRPPRMKLTVCSF